MESIIAPVNRLPGTFNRKKLPIATEALEEQLHTVLGSIDVIRALPALETLQIKKSGTNLEHEHLFVNSFWGHDML